MSDNDNFVIIAMLELSVTLDDADSTIKKFTNHKAYDKKLVAHALTPLCYTKIAEGEFICL